MHDAQAICCLNAVNRFSGALRCDCVCRSDTELWVQSGVLESKVMRCVLRYSDPA